MQCVIVVAALALSGCVVPGTHGRASVAAVAQADAEVVLEGTLEVLIEDAEDRSRLLYFLLVDTQRVPLRFLKAPANLTTGTRVRVRGRWDADKTLVVATLERL